LGRAAFHFSVMTNLPPSQWVSYIQGRMEVVEIVRTLRELQNPARRKNHTTQLAQHLLYALCIAHTNYNPGPYKGKVLSLESGGQKVRTKPSIHEGWDSLVPDRDIYHGPPGYIRLFDAPHIGPATERIRAALDSAVDHLSEAVDQYSDVTLSTR
jgi:thioesterase domain-containing protein